MEDYTRATISRQLEELGRLTERLPAEAGLQADIDLRVQCIQIDLLLRVLRVLERLDARPGGESRPAA